MDPFGHNTELNQLWRTAKESPSTFDHWVKLVEEAQKYDDIEHMRICFHALLLEFPLCFGYWQKWSEHERRHNNEQEAVQVLERGVKSTPHSPELWAFYAQHEVNAGKPDATESVRSIYERALTINGLDWRSGGLLWLKYIDWEAQLGNWVKVSSLYQRVIEVPNQDLGTFYSRYKELISNHPIHSLLMPHEKQIYENFKAAGLQVLAEEEEKEKQIAEIKLKDYEGPVKRERKHGHVSIFTRLAPLVESSNVDAATMASKAVEIAKITAEAEKKKVEAEKALAFEAKIEQETRDYLHKQIDEKYQVSYDGFIARYTFECGIQRNFFHSQPLDSSEIVNWHRYLDAEEKACDDALANPPVTKDVSPIPSATSLYSRWILNTISSSVSPNIIFGVSDGQTPQVPSQLAAPLANVHKLYERCLLVCLNYPEMWLRYSSWLEKHGLHSAINELWVRGTTTLCKRIPETFMHFANYAEANSQIELARKVYLRILNPNDGIASSFVSAITEYVNFERRQGNQTAIKSTLDRAIAFASGSSVVYLTLFAARLYSQIYANNSTARDIFYSALRRNAGNRDLWLGYIAWESNLSLCLPLEQQINLVHTICERALSPFAQVTVESSVNGSTSINISQIPQSQLFDADAQTIYDWYISWLQGHVKTISIIRHVQSRYSSLCASSFVTSSTFNARATKLMVSEASTKKRTASDADLATVDATKFARPV